MKTNCIIYSRQREAYRSVLLWAFTIAFCLFLYFFPPTGRGAILFLFPFYFVPLSIRNTLLLFPRFHRVEINKKGFRLVQLWTDIQFFWEESSEFTLFVNPKAKNSDRSISFESYREIKRTPPFYHDPNKHKFKVKFVSPKNDFAWLLNRFRKRRLAFLDKQTQRVTL